MENVLDVYHRPYDANYPVVCLDEASKQLITAIRPDLPGKSGQVRRKDSEYKRNGTANIFASLKEFVGNFWFWENAQVVIEGQFQCFEGLVPVGFSGGQFCFAV